MKTDEGILQKNHESTKEHNSKSQKLKFVMN
jgi:hypothetical protein